MSTPFTDALGLSADGDDLRAVLTPWWTVGTKAHGGMLLALCAKAARARLARDGGTDGMRPLAVSADFLGAPEPGEVELRTSVRKQGRTVSVVDVELVQAGRSAVRAVITLGTPDAGDPVHARSGSTDFPVEPPGDAIDVGAHAVGSVMTLATVCDLRFDPATVPFADGRVDPDAQVRLWVRPRGEEPDELFALLAGDVGPPLTLNAGLPGWAPTVQFTALLRGAPAPGWLRVTLSGHTVGRRWFDEDATVLDSAGLLVCQSRQLAMVPRP